MLLLDTCSFLWWASDDPAVPGVVRDRLRDPDEQVYLSSVSAWEICVKHALGKLPLPIPPWDYVPDRRRKLAIAALGSKSRTSCVSRSFRTCTGTLSIACSSPKPSREG
jgi:PIN domain nuclease of toxin-antitoxin system